MSFTCCSPDVREQLKVSKTNDLQLQQWRRDAKREIRYAWPFQYSALACLRTKADLPTHPLFCEVIFNSLWAIQMCCPALPIQMSIRTSCCPSIRQTIIKVLLIKALLNCYYPQWCLVQSKEIYFGPLGVRGTQLLNWSSTNTAMVLLHANNTEEHVIECKKPYSKLCKEWLSSLGSEGC